MKYNILDTLGKKILFFDGGMGSMLQKKGMTPGENTDVWNFTRPDDIMDVHRQYAEAGADILLTNMFGANRLKVGGTGYTVEQLVKQGIANARKVSEEFDRQIFVAADVAPTGKLLPSRWPTATLSTPSEVPW